MKLSRILTLWILTGVLFFSVNAQKNELQARLDAVINQAIKEDKIVGAATIVLQDGKVIYRKAAGFNDREARQKLKETDIFRLASMTKLIVSATALTLADEGKLNIEDDVTKYLPDFRPKLADGTTPKITIRHLLTHTAGLNYGFIENLDGAYHKLKVSDGLDDTGISLEENVRRIGSAPLLFAPGTKWNYSLSIDVLGLVLEKASGKSLPDLVREKITKPLKMNDSAFYVKNSKRLVVPYADGTPKPVRMTEPYVLKTGESEIIYSPKRATNQNAFPSGGAGMVGTIDDYAKFLEAIRKGGNPILKSASAKLLTENAIGEIDINSLTAPKGWGFTLGVSILKDSLAAKTPQSNGTWAWSGAYGHNYFVDPKEKITVICLTNTTIAGMAGEFPDAMMKAVYGK